MKNKNVIIMTVMVCVLSCLNIALFVGLIYNKDRDGNNRYITEVVTDNVYFTGDRKNDNSSQQSTTKNTKQNNTKQSNNQYNNPPANNYGGYSDYEMPTDDDLPF
jgi:single-stranded DNA-binding protein